MTSYCWRSDDAGKSWGEPQPPPPSSQHSDPEKPTLDREQQRAGRFGRRCFSTLSFSETEAVVDHLTLHENVIIIKLAIATQGGASGVPLCSPARPHVARPSWRSPGLPQQALACPSSADSWELTGLALRVRESRQTAPVVTPES